MLIPLQSHTNAQAQANSEDLLDSENLAAGVNMGTCTSGQRGLEISCNLSGNLRPSVAQR